MSITAELAKKLEEKKALYQRLREERETEKQFWRDLQEGTNDEQRQQLSSSGSAARVSRGKSGTQTSLDDLRKESLLRLQRKTRN